MRGIILRIKNRLEILIILISNLKNNKFQIYNNNNKNNNETINSFFFHFSKQKKKRRNGIRELD